ncbi:group IIE secretory phospholipase A2-like [Lissotriton helveticus]
MGALQPELEGFPNVVRMTFPGSLLKKKKAAVLVEIPPYSYALLLTFIVVPVSSSLINFHFMILGITEKDSLLAYNDYGCHCGYGGRGHPIDATDWCCHTHDCCYGDLLKKGCQPYWDNYQFTLTQGDVQCNNKKTCAQKACECDRLAALCFAKNNDTYSQKKCQFPKKYCNGSIPQCSYRDQPPSREPFPHNDNDNLPPNPGYTVASITFEGDGQDISPNYKPPSPHEDLTKHPSSVKDPIP